MPRLRSVALLAAALATAAIAAWFFAHQRAPIRLRLGTTPQVIASAVRIAEVAGDFKREGLDVEVVPFPSGKQALEAMLAGEIDVATVAETPLIGCAIDHRPVVVWATIAESQRSVCLVARGDRGVRGPADLAGRRIAVPRGTTAEVYLLAFLELYGIERANVTLIDTPPQEVGQRLAAGEVDVACVWEPLSSQIERTVPEPVVMHEDFLYRITWNLVGRTDASPVPVDALLRAIDRANARVIQADQGVVDEIGRWCALDPALVRRLLGYHHFCLQLEGSLLTEVEQQAKLLRSDGALPDLLRLVDARPLEDFFPAAVSLPVHAAR